MGYDKPYFELRSDATGEAWYCTLCNAWADEWHIQGKKHVKQVQYREETAYCPPAKPSQAVAAGTWVSIWSEGDSKYYYHNTITQAVQWEEPPGWKDPDQTAQDAAWEDPVRADPKYQKSYFEWRSDPVCGDGWFCQLCNQWADEGHLGGKRHLSQVDWHEHEEKAAASFGSKGKASSSKDRMGNRGKGHGKSEQGKANTRKDGQVERSAASQAEDWEEVWSEKDKCHYYFNRRANLTQWEKPECWDEPGPLRDSGWVRCWSEEHKDWYYHNTSTDATSWELPEPMPRTGDSGATASEWLGEQSC
mmetsp:Transcript_20836/g.47891  ORF Transcript_20836/g.47891 Transcript_20836/m.47891 type:complete len:305 (-) Transcript_20836:3-917(-)